MSKSKTFKGLLLTLLAISLVFALVGCSSSKAEESKKVVIYTNGDEEAVDEWRPH